MKTVGVIVEYNPLHFGHLHHLEQARQITGAHTLIAVMSPHVVQRGEFSVTDKFTRTRWALEAGIDLVIELPGIFALQSADLFAQTSVDILNKVGVDAICFGSETGDIGPLEQVLDVMESPAYQTLIKRYLDEGRSYPTSSDLALKELLGDAVSLKPNDTLGIQYLKAIRNLAPHIEPLAIKRVTSNYYDPIVEGAPIQSATAIRALHKAGHAFNTFVPSYVHQVLAHQSAIDLEDFLPYFAYRIITADASLLRTFFGCEEGLENRFLAAYPFDSVEALIAKIISPRYTNAKIKRTLMHMLIGTKTADVSSFTPPYIRVLGMNATGQKHLSKIKKTLNIPLITKLKGARHIYLDYELRITALYDLVKQDGLLDKEFDPVIIV